MLLPVLWVWWPVALCYWGSLRVPQGQFLITNTVWNSITETCVSPAAGEQLRCLHRPRREIPAEPSHAVLLRSLLSAELQPGRAGSTWEHSLNRRAETTKLSFPWVEWHQFTPAGNPARFHVSAHFGAFLLGVYKVADACKGKAGFPQLTFSCWSWRIAEQSLGRRPTW